VFRQAGYLGLNFVLMDGTAAYHNNDTAERLDKAGLQHLGSNMRQHAQTTMIAIASPASGHTSLLGYMISCPNTVKNTASRPWPYELRF
jgi:hypothetical protein